MDMGFAGLAAAAANVGFGEAEYEFGSSASRARAAFQWGGTVFALILLILNRAGRRSAMQSNFLVLYLFTSFPTVLFKILRGQFGYWVSFLAVAANLFFPQTIPVSRFLLFVVTPVWVANGLRDSIVGCIFCLILGVSLVIAEIRGIGGFCNCRSLRGTDLHGLLQPKNLLKICSWLHLQWSKQELRNIPHLQIPGTLQHGLCHLQYADF
ncbi:cold-regulated 413 plasma membrane protein 4-like isoform X2 [Pyrus x bretschneideri]|uniref:cold-regulated 413 plasma membrane protein 4-like isoform X2 n=1 Tax=Pyrus x bretschneideri TaxID=225117 RepID=UPI00202EA215|nr:cold-regulated 413 plasma membrane protein 4-like isoform X2 [Pyrus x bretschneideri]